MLEGVDKALHYEDVEDALSNEVTSFLSKVPSELLCCITSFPLTAFKAHEELGAFYKLVSIILSSFLHDSFIIFQLFKYSSFVIIFVEDVCDGRVVIV